MLLLAYLVLSLICVYLKLIKSCESQIWKVLLFEMTYMSFQAGADSKFMAINYDKYLL